MDQYIQSNITKYQKTWPEPKCKHEMRYKSGNTRGGKQHHTTSTELNRKFPNTGHVIPKTTLPASEVTDIIQERFNENFKQQTRTGRGDLSPRSTKDVSTLTSVHKSGPTNNSATQPARSDRRERHSASGPPSSILRTYDTKNNYGTLYQLRKLQIRPHAHIADNKGENWFWEKDYRLWRKHYKQRLLGDVSTDEVGEKSAKAKPHPDLYGAFNSLDLHKQLEEQGATTIQKLARGWLVRRQLARLKNTAAELRLQLDDGVKDYLTVRSNVTKRLHILKENPQLDLHDVRAFLEQKKEYEEVFKRLSTLTDRGRTLPAQDLREFFTACGLNPSDREINTAFRSVFGGSPDLEIVILVDRSELSGPLATKTHLSVATDIAASLSGVPAVSRVVLAPFDDSAADIISLQTKESEISDKDTFMKQIDAVKFHGGQRNTHLALEQLRDCFKSSSPGASKIGIVITGGVSAAPDKTSLEAAIVREENISLFTVGIGHGASGQDISPPGNAYLVSGLGAWKRKSVETLEEILAKSRFAHAGHTTLYTEEHCRPLGKDEVLAILWTIYPPQGVAARTHRRSTWVHPIVDGMEASPALEEEMSKQTALLPCLSLMIRARLARDGFILLPSEGPSGTQRVHDLDTALAIFQHYLQTGKLDHLLT